VGRSGPPSLHVPRKRAMGSEKARKSRSRHKGGRRVRRPGGGRPAGDARAAPRSQGGGDVEERLSILPERAAVRIASWGKGSLVLAAAYVAVVGFFAFKYHVIGGYGVETDFYTFASQAKKLVYGGFETDGARGPVYFVVLALAGETLGDYFRAGMAIGLLSAGLALFFTNRLLGRLFGREAAFLGTALTALNPAFVQFTYSSGTDMFFVALATMSAYFFLSCKRLSYPRVVVVGLLCAVTYLTRYNGVFLAGGVVLTLLFLDIWGFGRRERIGKAAVFVAVFFAATVPWGLFLKHQMGEFFYNPNYKNVAYLVYGQGKVDWDEFVRKQGEEFHSFADVVRRDPHLFAGTVVRSAYRHAVGDLGELMGWHVGALAVLGVLLSLSFRRRKRLAAYALFNILAFAVLVMVAYNPRFSLFLVPFYSLLAMRALALVKERVGGRVRIAAWMAAGVAVALLGFTAAQCVAFNKDEIRKGPKHVLKTAAWFKEKVPVKYRKGVVVARKPHIAYYLGLDFKWIPDVKSYDDLIASLRAMRAEYLYFSMIEAHWRPQLRFLLDPESEHPGLAPLMYVGKPPVSVLYKVVYDSPPKGPGESRE